jgi:hypothetical protein
MKQKNDIMKKNNDIIKQPMKNINTMKIMKKFLFLKIFFLTLYSPTIFAITCSTGSGGSSGSYSWDEVPTNSPVFSGRFEHSSVAFGGKMWVIGGSDGTVRNDVWSSVDGKNWTEETKDSLAKPAARRGHQTLDYDGKMWIIGGFSNTGRETNSVYRSTNGATWTQVRADGEAGFPVRARFGAVVFNKQMWVISGLVRGVRDNDVWNSTNGATWYKIKPDDSNGFSARESLASVVFHDGQSTKMWVIGGFDDGLNESRQDDVWNSTNGLNWNLVSSGKFPRTQGLKGVVFNDGSDEKMWINSGLNPSLSNIVYSSTDGITWANETPVEFPARVYHSSIVFNNRIWVIGGAIDSGHANDVWHYSK